MGPYLAEPKKREKRAAFFRVSSVRRSGDCGKKTGPGSSNFPDFFASRCVHQSGEFPHVPNSAKKTRKSPTPRRLNISRIGGGIKSAPRVGRFLPVLGGLEPKKREKKAVFFGFQSCEGPAIGEKRRGPVPQIFPTFSRSGKFPQFAK